MLGQPLMYAFVIVRASGIKYIVRLTPCAES